MKSKTSIYVLVSRGAICCHPEAPGIFQFIDQIELNLDIDVMYFID